jgi:hypothetical protein
MTFNELQAALHGYMHRDDPETVANEPTALEIARLKLARTFFPAVASEIEPLAFTDNLNGTASAPLPTDFGQADVLLVMGGGDLEYLTPREFARRWAQGRLAGVYTTEGVEVRAAASLVTTGALLTYYRQPFTISGTEENWCSHSYPDVWLWQALAEQHRFVQDAESADLAEAYSEELAASATVNTRANREGGVLRMSTR